MLIRDVIAEIERFAPLAYQEDYDNAGLITGSANWEAKAALLCLDTTEAVIDEAIEKNCNLVIAHHPILFSGLKKITGKTYVERVIIKAIKNDIAIYAAHTNLDNVRYGVNHKIAKKLGLINCQTLAPKSKMLRKLIVYVPLKEDNIDDPDSYRDEHVEHVKQAIFNAGGGAIGNYDQCSFTVVGTGTFRGNDNANPTIGDKNEYEFQPEAKVEIIYPHQLERTIVNAMIKAHPYEEVAYSLFEMQNATTQIGSGLIGELKEETSYGSFLTHVKTTMKCGVIKHTKLLDRPMKTVAICGGSGSFLLNNAIAAKADIFITADYTYHKFFDADGKIVIADIGHYESEQYTNEIFSEILSKKMPNFALLFTETNTNPIKYF